jgi:hypothetical protein
LALLVRGSPMEIRIRDCSWLAEEEFTKNFEVCDSRNLTVCLSTRLGLYYHAFAFMLNI